MLIHLLKTNLKETNFNNPFEKIKIRALTKKLLLCFIYMLYANKLISVAHLN